MEKFIEALKEMGVCFRRVLVDDKTLCIVIVDDSACPIVDFWFDDETNFVKVQSSERLLINLNR